MPDENVEQTEEAQVEATEASEASVEPVVEPSLDPEAPAETAEDVPVAVAEQPAAEAAAPEPTADAAVAAPVEKKKRKRLPRALRRERPKPRREKPAERKPITRVPKPEHPRGRRQERQGMVVSAAADKTIVVRVDVVKLHPTYKKVIRRSTKLHAHDEQNQAKVGDVVRIIETRPLSRLKRWRLREIVEEAK